MKNKKKQSYNFTKRQQKVLWLVQMVEYSKLNVKLWDTQLKKLKTAVKEKAGSTLRMSLKMFDANGLPYELLTTRQKTKLGNAFNSNMSTDIKLSKAQISKIIQPWGFLGSLLGKLSGPLMKVAVIRKNIFACLFSILFSLFSILLMMGEVSLETYPT